MHWVFSLHPKTSQSITCRLCANDSSFDRFKVKQMVCAFCRCCQPCASACVNPECTQYNVNHSYYCNKCHLWENRTTKHIFHCHDCGICRVGKREDYTHCDKCCMCIPKNKEHACVGGYAKDNPCPICYEDIATSVEPALFMSCGHALHKQCFIAWWKHGGSRCPMCLHSSEL